jgi:hypothetical protein
MKRFISQLRMTFISIQIARCYYIFLQLQNSVVRTLPQLAEAYGLEYSMSTYWKIWQVAAVIKHTVFGNFSTLVNIHHLSFMLKT